MPKRPSLAAASRLKSVLAETEMRKSVNPLDRNSANAENTEERKTVKLSFAIPIRTHEELKVLAVRQHQAIGALVEKLINAELARHG